MSVERKAPPAVSGAAVESGTRFVCPSRLLSLFWPDTLTQTTARSSLHTACSLTSAVGCNIRLNYQHPKQPVDTPSAKKTQSFNTIWTVSNGTEIVFHSTIYSNLLILSALKVYSLPKRTKTAFGLWLILMRFFMFEQSLLIQCWSTHLS